MARDKKTEPSEQPDELQPLNEQEIRLIEALAGGANNCEAYKIAYGAEGYSPAALRVRACRKVAEKKIQQHLLALTQVGLANAALTRESWVEMMLAAAARAEASGNHGAAATSRIAVGKALGFQVEKVEDVTQYDPVRTLDEIAKHAPELAESFARQHGINWQPKESVH